MPRPSFGNHRIRRSAAALSLIVLGFGASAAFMAHGTSKGHAPLPVQASVRPAPTHGPRSGLDHLRDEATLGNELANRDLVKTLLDRYDQRGDSDDLYEAMMWIDKQWELTGNAEMAGRVVASYCDQRVVRWHWLCSNGE